MKKGKYFLLILFCFWAIDSKCIGQNVDNAISNSVQLNKTKQGPKDSLDFLKFISLFPNSPLSDSNRIVNTSNTIPMRVQYQKYLSKDLILHTGSFLSGIYFFNNNFYVGIFYYMEEHSQERKFYTQILLYNLNGTILKEMCVLNGQDEPEFIGEWFICTSSITHQYFGPYINDDSHPVNCKETRYSLSTDTPLIKVEERCFSTIKSFVW